ncbi:MAG TPA: polysaccharide deacetylase family protein [Bacillales bacterium]|nr:polysaccharide deacetylase family protein [Bacillales bacterium]
MKKLIVHWTAFVLIFLFAFGTVQNPWTSRYIHDLKQDPVVSVDQNNPLYEKIVQAAEKYNEPAIDAKIDPVWKAVPGYNGIKVDVAASYKKMMKDGQRFANDRLVFRQVEPDVHLNDLKPAPIYKGNPNKPMVSLMVNVAWGNEYIPKMLKVLKQEHVRATFFLDGSWVKKNPDLAKMIAEAGNEIGNHAYSHPDMKALSAEAARRQIVKTNEVIRSTLEMKPKLFAPPSGSYNKQTVKVVDSLGMKTIMWTVDTVDWKNPNPDAMVMRVLQNIGSGSLVLMHPTKASAEGLAAMIHGIRERGYQIGTVSALLDEDRL